MKAIKAIKIQNGHCLNVQMKQAQNSDYRTHVKRWNPTSRTEIWYKSLWCIFFWCTLYIIWYLHLFAAHICSFLTLGLRCLFWSVALLLALACSTFFVYSNTIDFLRATIVTTLDTQNVPLSEVFFPSVVVCNLNQVWLQTLELFCVIWMQRFGSLSSWSLG